MSAPGQPTSQRPRGRTNAYVFFVQKCRQDFKLTNPGERVGFAVFARSCSERWKMMTDEEKKHFRDLAEQDRNRFEYEMNYYVPPKGMKKNGRPLKKGTKKDPNAPKRALPAFFWFCRDERPKFKLLYPQYKVRDIAKHLGQIWAQLSDDLKAKYEVLAQRDKARYHQEMIQYRNSRNIPHPKKAAYFLQNQGQQQQQQHPQHPA